MKEVIQKTLIKGMNADEMPQEVNDDTVQYALNMRRLHSEGDTMSMQNLKGTDKAITFPSGTKILGTCTHLDVCFFLGVNTETNHSFIGTYPSPKYDGTEGYVHEFKYLNNYTGSVNQYNSIFIDAPETVPVQPLYVPYQTGLLPLIDSTSFEIEAVSKGENDGSVTLYWTDRNNPVKTINCGFYLKTGLPNYRFYSNEQLNSGYLELLNESKQYVDNLKQSRLDIQKIEPYLEIGGQLDAGGYHFFFKYVDEYGNKTSCYDQSRFVFTTVGSKEGIKGSNNSLNTNPNNIKGGAAFSKTNKYINLQLNFLDSAYPYVEIYYAYHYSGDEWVEEATTEYRKIIKPYWKGNNRFSNDINIYGTEEYTVVSRDELFSEKSNHNIAKTIAIVDNTLYLGNTKESKPLHRKEYADFAQLVKPILIESEAEESHGFQRQVKGHFLYNTPSTEIGYFSGEIYAFAVRYRLASGRLTASYPIKGVDLINANMINRNDYHSTNDKGIVRFPMANTNPFILNSVLSIKYLEFDFSEAQANVQLNDVVQIEVLRTKRNPLMLYQGIALTAFSFAKKRNSLKLLQDHFVYAADRNGYLNTNPFQDNSYREDISHDLVPLFAKNKYPQFTIKDEGVRPLTFIKSVYVSYYPKSNYSSVYKLLEPEKMIYQLPFPDVLTDNYNHTKNLGLFSFDYFIDSKVDNNDSNDLFFVPISNFDFNDNLYRINIVKQSYHDAFRPDRENYGVQSIQHFFFDQVAIYSPIVAINAIPSKEIGRAHV